MIAYLKNLLTTTACISLICCGCMPTVAPAVAVNPKQFNTHIPFRIDNKGIVISTLWGTAKKEHKLYLDNHSPTWATNSIIEGDSSISKSKDFLFSTTTADGKTIEGDVYMCDSISIGAVNFKNVAFYNISNESNAGKIDGAIGENIMSKGVWKIDFKEHIINFASSLDSIKALEETERLPAIFTADAIDIEVIFSNKVKKTVELDLGYNGGIILPAKEFKPIAAGNQKTFTVQRRSTTPAGTAMVDNTMVPDSIQIGRRYFMQAISTNKLIKEKLIGLAFFNQFEYIIIDYPGKAVYISKKRVYDIPEMK